MMVHFLAACIHCKNGLFTSAARFSVHFAVGRLCNDVLRKFSPKHTFGNVLTSLKVWNKVITTMVIRPLDDPT